jgi:hypothetical protein
VESLRETAPANAARSPGSEPIWHVRHHLSEIHPAAKIVEKLTDTHLNPVRDVLVSSPIGWRLSSARWYTNGQMVEVPIQWAN